MARESKRRPQRNDPVRVVHKDGAKGRRDDGGLLVRIQAILLAAGLALGAASPVAASGSGGAVGIVVVDVGACITVDGGFDFGVQDLGDPDPQVSLPQTVTVTNCNERHVADIYGRGTDAVGDGTPAATWTLHQSPTFDCVTFQPNRYKVGLAQADVGGAPMILSYNDTLLNPTPELPSPALGAGGSREYVGGLYMPCPGSDGAGQTMTFAYIFTAVLRDV